MRSTPLLTLTLSIPALSATALAGPVFSQPVVSDPALVGRGWFSHSEPREIRNFKHADDFTLTADATVGSVRWWGLSEGRFRDDLGNFDAFTIEFYLADQSGPDPLPGILIASTTLTLGLTDPTLTGRADPANGAFEYAHAANLDAPVHLLAGQTYFLAISARSINGRRDGWKWSDADGSDRLSATFAWTTGEWSAFIDTDSAFELIAVPAPGSAVLVGLGLLLTPRRRR